jgi:hypothetical protein
VFWVCGALRVMRPLRGDAVGVGREHDEDSTVAPSDHGPRPTYTTPREVTQRRCLVSRATGTPGTIGVTMSSPVGSDRP